MPTANRDRQLFLRRPLFWRAIAILAPANLSIHRDNQQWFDYRPGIILVDDNDTARPDGNKIGMRHGKRAAVRESNIERFERLLM